MKPLQFGKHKKITYAKSKIKDIAIVGVHGVFPNADNPKDFWNKIYQKENLIKEIPQDHFDYIPWYNPKKGVEDMLYTKWGSFINNVDKFDADFFNISPIEAEMMDPQLRYMLQVLYHTIEDAGAINEIKGTDTGLYVGACFHDYGQEMDRLGLKVNPHDGTGNAATMLANRPSFYFDLKGPSMVIDTACSSSLIALHTACKAIQNNECKQALVAGANLLLSSVHYRYFSSIGALSATGRCHSFDSKADGYIPGESVAAIMLKPLEEAEKNGDFIHGVIKGSATTHGGYTPSITAPSVDGEVDVLLKAWEDAEVSPESLGYIEAHGTGTKLGDPIEVNALKKAFKKHTAKTMFCAIGSAKAHIGHAEGAAGIVGVIKALFSIKNQKIPAMPKFEELNPYISLENSPFFINKKPLDWNRDGGVPLRAGISSFGFGGAYAHVVLEEYIQNNKNEFESHLPVFIPLSAKTEKVLTEMIENLIVFIETEPYISIYDLSYTLQVNREQLDKRVVFKVNDKEELIHKLKGYQRKEEKKTSIPIKLNDSEVKTLIKNGEVDQLFKKWLAGAIINWNLLYGKDKPNKITLPNYPFAKERYWLTIPKKTENKSIQTKQIHPLLHNNISTLNDLKFKSVYDGGETFLSDHNVMGKKIFPGVAYIELIRVAGEVVGKQKVKAIKNITWINPISVDRDKKEIQLTINKGSSDFNVLVKSEDHNEERTHCEASIEFGEHEVKESELIISDFIRSASREITGKELYSDFFNAGLNLGESFQGVQKIFVKDNIAIAQLKNNTNKEFKYSPGILDSALHAIYGLAIAPEENYSLAFPYHIKEVLFHAEIKADMELWSVAKENKVVNGQLTSYDVDLWDANGNLLIQFKEFVAIPFNSHLSTDKIDGHAYLPIWKRLKVNESVIEKETSVLILTGKGNNKGTILTPLLKVLKEQEVTIIIAEELTSLEEHVESIYFVNGLFNERDTQELLIEKEIFNTLKTLTHLRKDKLLNLCFFTQSTQAVYNCENVNSFGSGIVGLIGSLAKEYSNWNTKIIDLGKADWNTEFINKQRALGYDEIGQLHAYRNGVFYKLMLSPFHLKQRQTKFKRSGVYVILGGAGGIGAVTTKHLVEKYQAQVIWLGRSEYTAKIKEKQAEIREFGPCPEYIQCDALNLSDLRNAQTEVNRMFGPVNGLFHSAIVLNDMRFEQMDADNFDHSYLPKSLASQNFVETFKNDALDFVCFYSSIQSQWNAAGQSNYSAGCTFKDSFSREIESNFKIPSYTINWGYWGEVGIVSGSNYSERMNQLGIESISNKEGMLILEGILSNNVHQVIAINLTSKAKAMVKNLQESERYQKMPIISSVNMTIPTVTHYSKNIDDEKLFQSISEKGIFQVLLKMGLSEQLQKGTNLLDIQTGLGIQNKYNRLFNEIMRQMTKEGYLVLRNDTLELSDFAKRIIPDFNFVKSMDDLGNKNKDFHSQSRLLIRCLDAFPEVLKGEIQATEVLFPEGSMEYVSGIYKGNKQSDYLNELIASTITKTIAEAITKLPIGEKLQIMEVGAGTGGTSDLLFNKLIPYKDVIEYTYTDLSKSFLIYGESNYKEIAPYLKTTLFNIEESPSSQGIELGKYDIVLGANVVHATKNMNDTVANLKQVLKTNGLLILNELATTELFTTLTFGLLDGWWLYNDPEIRLQGSPGLSAQGWKQVLSEEGFLETVSYPETQKIPQQMIIAKSNGMIKTKKGKVNEMTQEDEEQRNEIIDGEDENWLIDKIVTIASETIKYSKDKFDIHKQFMDYGFDSILGVSLIKNINTGLNIKLSPTEIFNYPNVSQLASYIQTNFSKEIKEEVKNKQLEKEITPTFVPFEENKSTIIEKEVIESDIAIIGMSGQFGAANNLHEYWEALSKGKSLIEEVPPERWDQVKHFSTDKDEPNKTYSKWGSFLKDIDKFDPLFFGISGGEAEMMDPQQRLFLQHAWKAIEDAGINPRTLSNKKCGVYIGASTGDYLNSAENKPAAAFWGNSCAILPARISYLLNLKGPALPIDTACSSSLVALDVGCKSLLNGDTDVVITGGVTIMNSPNFYKLSSRAGMLSENGTCYVFDKRANGFVPGEGIGVLVLKRLKDAERDGDVIHGLVKGTVVNQDGTSNGILAPSVLSQESLEKEAYEKFNINPKTISYVEAHGTGTALGDPIEFEALTKAFNAFSCPPQNCAIGSVKTNIGHTLMAAGVAGIIKVLLSFKNKQLPPSLNFETQNSLINFEDSPFRLQKSLDKWTVEEGSMRKAAVSSFGFSGTNAHVILEEYNSPKNQVESDKKHVLIVLSAKTIGSLKRTVENIKYYLDYTADVRLVDIAYTLQLGRETMNQKIGFIVRSKAELIEKLDDFLTNEKSNKYTITNSNSQLSQFNKKETNNFLRKAILSNDLNLIMLNWLEGATIDWNLFYTKEKAIKLSLPTYSFEKQRYWRPEEDIEKLIQKTVIEKKEKGSELNLFQQKWRKGTLESTGVLKGVTLIISDGTSKALTQKLQKALGSSQIVNKAEDVVEMEQVVGCIDLSPLENKKEADFNWLLLLQKLIKSSKFNALKLLVVNEGSKTEFSNQFGLYQMLQGEYSKVNSLLLDLDREDDLNKVNIIMDAYRSVTNYTHLKRTDKEWHFPYLSPFNLEFGKNDFALDNPVIITGGTRGLGMICAKHLAFKHGFKKLILIGERVLPAREDWDELRKNDNEIGIKIREIQDLEKGNVQVKVIAKEITNNERLIEEIKSIEDKWGEIKGVLHCAGIVDLETPAFINKELHTIKKVLKPKEGGIIELDQLLDKNKLDFAVLFSSIATFPILGSGQSDYVMANSYLNYFAKEQQKIGKPYTSIQWPNWENVGISKIEGGIYDQLGLNSITVDEGLNLLDKVISNQELPPVVAPISTKIKEFQFNKLFEIPKKKKVKPEIILEVVNTTIWLKKIVAKELKFSVEVIDINVPIQDFGVDSVILVQFIKALEKELGGVSIDPTAILENPTIALLANYLENQFPLNVSKLIHPTQKINSVNNKVIPKFVIEPDLEEKSDLANEKYKVKMNAPIAVIGMGCHFPEAENIKEFWENLRNGKDAVCEVPKSRWDVNEFYDPQKGVKGKSISKWGGFLNDIENFDPTYFGIKKDLASQIDPLQRQWLEVCTETIVDSGYTTESLSGKNIGVYAGSRLSTFRNKITEPSNDFIVGTGQNFIAAHLSHIYNLKGPNMVVDTACSSALTAIDLAVKDLRLGETEMALAGGVDIILDEEIFVTLSRLSILSPSGRSKTFDQSADGTGLGEGCGVIMLKRLDDAIEAGDKIYGVIEGTAVNNDGRTMGVTTPNPQAQEELIEKGIANAGIEAESIGYIESHGTGTLIGDPIELKGVTRVLRKHTDENTICAIGSVKSNIGHLLSAAGIAGVIKTLLAIQAKEIPPTLHCNEPNKRFDFKNAPIYPVLSLENWEGINGVRRAGVSAFGLGGNNAFVVISNEGIPDKNKVLWPLEITKVNYNKERYWPVDKVQENQKKQEDEIFAKSLEFKIKDYE